MTETKRSFVVPPAVPKDSSNKAGQAKIKAYHFTEKGVPVIEEFNFLEDSVQISFQGLPYLHSHKYIAQGSTLDVNYPHIQLYLIQAARIPNLDNNMIIYLWHGNKAIQPQSVECNLSIESMVEKSKNYNIKAKCNITQTGATITDIKFENIKYTDITLPLSISGAIVLSK
jgi:hypothetical protein